MGMDNGGMVVGRVWVNPDNSRYVPVRYPMVQMTAILCSVGQGGKTDKHTGYGLFDFRELGSNDKNLASVYGDEDGYFMVPFTWIPMHFTKALDFLRARLVISVPDPGSPPPTGANAPSYMGWARTTTYATVHPFISLKQVYSQCSMLKSIYPSVSRPKFPSQRTSAQNAQSRAVEALKKLELAKTLKGLLESLRVPLGGPDYIVLAGYKDIYIAPD